MPFAPLSTMWTRIPDSGQLNSDGTSDTTYGDQGVAFVPMQSIVSIRDLAATQGGGELFPGANRNNDPVIARFTANGSLDTRLANDGIRVASALNMAPVGVALQSDGKILVSGSGSGAS